MPDAFHAEFTGERVIPGRVEDNLFNEHLARYRFASRLSQPTGRALDAGCGAGYGTAELARGNSLQAIEVLGIDVSQDAVEHARANYPAANIRFEQASCLAIPAEAGAFRLITAFEVIEHLEDWPGFLREASRVLANDGLFLVSTPNKLYYAESREKAGPNPFHVHEFTAGEFRAELESVFPHVTVLLQNHVEGIALSAAGDHPPALEIASHGAGADSAHFFLAVCGKQPLPEIATFVFIPDSGNVLQTRERHIALLAGEIAKKNQWIEREQDDRRRMLDKVRSMEVELEEHNQWAKKANVEADRRAQLVSAIQAELEKSNQWARLRDAEAVERGDRVEQLQQELARSNQWAHSRDVEAVERGQRVVALQNEVAQATAWAKDRESEAEERGQRVVALQDELAQTTAWAKNRESEAEERGARVVALQEEVAQATAWAKRQDVEVEDLRRELAVLAQQYTRLEQESAATTTGYEAAIADWRQMKEASDRWAVDTERRLSAERDDARAAFSSKSAEYESALERIAAMQHESERLRAELSAAHGTIDMIAQSRWVRLGRKARVGPEIRRNS